MTQNQLSAGIDRHQKYSDQEQFHLGHRRRHLNHLDKTLVFQMLQDNLDYTQKDQTQLVGMLHHPC
jgi:hypothetical protein